MITARERRYQKLQDIGCLACAEFGATQPSDMHHLLSGHVRIGDRATVPLCPWHHRGYWSDRFDSQAMAEIIAGPSLALSSKKFRERFGSDAEMLERANCAIGAA